MERVVSGVRPTGHIHLGNYFGAIKNFVELQDKMDCFFFIADYHSLTTHPKPEALHQHVKEVLATYLACGLDPEKTTLYIQSDLPQIPELYLLMNMLAYVGELERSTTYKDKVAKQQHNINAGLLTYPVLMAVDVIIHKATKVPVGKDQEQHMEMARNFVNRFNHLYNVDYFPEPYGFNFGEKLIKIPGLDGTGKMGKSEGEKNAVYLGEAPDSIRKKVMKAVTDSGPTAPNQPKHESVENLFTLLKVVSSPETYQYFEEQYNNATIRYGDLKKQLADDVIAFTSPIREKMEAYMANEPLLSEVVHMGAEKARASASATLRDVREIIGIKTF
ncbi:MAG: tryptophan--tRNA ligase [Chitinophagales bacterium]|nr:tryptophan--tRNA ligase [Chitinophagales bacterium]